MTPAARGWFDALFGIATFFTLTALCDPAPAATAHRVAPETHMPKQMSHPSHGPFSWHRPAPGGYTTIHDRDGRMIGAATTTAGLDDIDTIIIGRLFASSHTLCAALTAYMNAVDKATDGGEGFTEEIIEALAEARQEALEAFDILFGRSGERTAS